MTYNIRAVQAAVHAALAADSALQSLLGSPVRLYDHAPPATPYPFVRYGDQRADTTSAREGSELVITFALETYSRYCGRHELRQIEEAIHAVLHDRQLDIEDGTIGQCQFVQSAQTLASDGLTYSSTMRFRIVTYI